MKTLLKLDQTIETIQTCIVPKMRIIINISAQNQV